MTALDPRVTPRVSIFLMGDLGGNFFDRKEALHAESRRREARGSHLSIAFAHSVSPR